MVNPRIWLRSVAHLFLRQRICQTLLLVVLDVTFSSLAQAATYSFANVADTMGPISGFGSGAFSPVINASGTVAFYAHLDGGGSVIYTSRDGEITTIAARPSNVHDATAGEFIAFTSRLSIDATGAVAFMGDSKTAGYGVFVGSGGPVTTIVTEGGDIRSLGDASMNLSGTVAFKARLSSGGEGIYTSSGGSYSPLVTTDGEFTSFGNPAISDSGKVVFNAVLDSGEEGIFTTDGGPATRIAMESPSFDIQDSDPVINAGGTVAFCANGQLFTGSGDALNVVANSNGRYFRDHSINTEGTVAFSLARSFMGGFVVDTNLQSEYSSNKETHCSARHLLVSC
jgi:hypothetical protein